MKTITDYLLINASGCIFDRASFSSVSKAKQWASGRGGKYRLFKWVDEVGQVFVSNHGR